MNCPECGMKNPEDTWHCDCGYDFKPLLNNPSMPKSDNKKEVDIMAESRGWPSLQQGNYSSHIFQRVFTGLFIGFGIIALLARGNGEGIFRLLIGQGSGVGIIIMVIFAIGGLIFGINSASANSKLPSSGKEEWSAWLNGEYIDEQKLKLVKEILEKLPEIKNENNPS